MIDDELAVDGHRDLRRRQPTPVDVVTDPAEQVVDGCRDDGHRDALRREPAARGSARSPPSNQSRRRADFRSRHGVSGGRMCRDVMRTSVGRPRPEADPGSGGESPLVERVRRRVVSATNRRIERLDGADAILWHLEGQTPMHTLKVLIVDPSRRGSPLSAVDVTTAIAANIDRYPRARQRVMPAFGRRGHPYWVDVPDLDITEHVDERRIASPGGRRELDTIFGELAARCLAPDRPLWHLTLVSGLERGRQALVWQLHHAVTDGSAAAAAFEALTSSEPGGEPTLPPIPAASPPERTLRATAIRQVGNVFRSVPSLARVATTSNQRAAEFRDRAQHLPPPGWSQYRDTFLVKTDLGDRRVCATASLPLSDFQAVGRWAGVTLNGVLHGVLAGALRSERLRRGEDPSRPLGAAFGIALDDPAAPPRYWGNNVSPTYVLLHTEETDPEERLRRTAASAREGAELRRHAGPDAIAHVSNHLPRLPATIIRRLKGRLPAPAHLVTANVRGPGATRWLGECEVVDWYSFAVIVPPLPVNLTVYSYAGEMKFGLLSEPDTFPEPEHFMAAIEASLCELVELVD